MKKLKVFLIVLIILSVAVTSVYFWQRENIKSVYYSAKYDDDKIDELILKHNEDVETYLKEHGGLNVRPSTPVEEKLHQSGVISDDELVDILTGRTNLKTLVGTDVKLDEQKKFVDESGNAVSVDSLKQYKQNNTTASGTESEDKSNDKSFAGDYADGDNASAVKDDNKSGGSQNSGGKNESKSLSEKKDDYVGGVSSDDGIGSKSITQKNESGAGENGSDRKNTGKVSESHSESGSEKRTEEKTDSKNEAENPKEDSGVTASDYIAQLYALKSSYVSQIDNTINSAVAAYGQMSSEEKKQAKTMLKDYYNSAVGLEQQCDSEVEGIISKLTAELTATGGDLSIVDKIRDAYSNEKSLKKAQYINKIK